MADECEHGSLARSCEICERDGVIARLSAALQAVEWMNEFDNDAPRWCPWCDNWQHDGHKPNCQRQAALDAAGE